MVSICISGLPIKGDIKTNCPRKNIEQLDYLGFLWDPLEEQWEATFRCAKGL